MEHQELTAKECIAFFRQYVLEKESMPSTMYALSAFAQKPEASFYKEFNSTESLLSGFWLHLFNDAKTRLESQEVYQGYNAKERILAFYFTFMEHLAEQRSFLFLLDRMLGMQAKQASLKKIHAAFKEWISNRLSEGKDEGEIANRKFLEDQYPEAFWLQLQFLIRFWLSDDSDGFQKTDAAIEKSLNLTFELMGPGVLDALVDFGKFAWQNRGVWKN
jgi:hypothetical protein